MSILFFGEDREPSAGMHPDADAAKVNFFSYLNGSTTETFEGFENTPYNHYIDISAGRVSPRGNISDHVEGGIFGEKCITTGDNEGFILSISFTDPVAAFGLYCIGKTFHHDMLRVSFSHADGSTQQLEPLQNLDASPDPDPIDKLIAFLGIIDKDNPITSVNFTRRSGHGFSWDFDNITTASADQVDMPHHKKGHHHSHRGKHGHHKNP